MFSLLTWALFGPSAAMGIGIAIDVAIATIVQYRDEELSFGNWTLPVMTTHIGFPALGYYGFWYLGERFESATLILGIIGFVLVALFLYEAICEWSGREPIFGISKFVGKCFGINAKKAGAFLTVLAVSWDALWSGPAKAAQAEAAQWSDQEVFLSFFIAGVIVAIVAQASLWVATQMRKKQFKSAINLALFNIFGKYAEVSVIGGFGALSLMVGIKVITLFQAICIAAAFFFVVFALLRKSLWTTEVEEAMEAVGIES